MRAGREIVQSIYGIDFNLVRSKVMDPGFDDITLSSSFLEEARFTQGYVLYRSLRNRIPREYTFLSLTIDCQADLVKPLNGIGLHRVVL